ncbi:MAG: aminotransferase class V-fold PLP-dependent enzyme [Deltaproteobacteria bacterium]|nr:aminotransferase class V-fold PLP-dependent enzyme [Deltaproteobacteria bacterium]
MSALLGQRHLLFPDVAAKVYAAHAAFTPLSRPARDAVVRHLAAHAAHGVGFVKDALAVREALRAELGRLLGVAPATLGFVQGTTAGVIAVAHALAWRPGDVVVTFEGEFPANVSPWLDVVARHGLGHRHMAADLLASDDGLDALERLLAPGDVRLVAVSAVQFQTGLAMPLAAMAELCHRHGALLFVDAIQAAGIVPLDLTALGVDLAVGGAHKWLCGLDGAGWVYVAPGREAALSRPAVGWLSHEDGARFLFEGPGELRYDRPLRPAPRVFEGGSSSSAALIALHEGVSLLNQVGVAAAYEHVQRWHDLLEPALVARGFVSARAATPARRSGILSFRPPPGTSLPELQQRLAAGRVIVSIPDGWLRFAPHFASTLDEPALVLEALGP